MSLLVSFWRGLITLKAFCCSKRHFISQNYASSMHELSIAAVGASSAKRLKAGWLASFLWREASKPRLCGVRGVAPASKLNQKPHGEASEIGSDDSFCFL